MYLSRNRKLLLGAAATAVLAFGIWHLSVPNEYEASTLLLVDPPQLPDSYVHSETSLGIASRLRELKDRVLSRTRLQRIIETNNLYESLKGRKTEAEILDRMRGDIRMQVVRRSDGLPDDGILTFRISYRGDQPRAVARVCNQLATLFIDENYTDRQRQAMSAVAFIEEQLRLARKDLIQAQDSVSAAIQRGNARSQRWMSPFFKSIMSPCSRRSWKPTPLSVWR